MIGCEIVQRIADNAAENGRKFIQTEKRPWVKYVHQFPINAYEDYNYKVVLEDGWCFIDCPTESVLVFQSIKEMERETRENCVYNTSDPEFSDYHKGELK